MALLYPAQRNSNMDNFKMVVYLLYPHDRLESHYAIHTRVKENFVPEGKVKKGPSKCPTQKKKKRNKRPGPTTTRTVVLQVDPIRLLEK